MMSFTDSRANGLERFSNTRTKRTNYLLYKQSLYKIFKDLLQTIVILDLISISVGIQYLQLL